MAVVEFARHVLDLRDAHTSEVDPHTTYPVIDLMEDQDLGNLGGTMRLGKYRCLLTPGTISEKAYGTSEIWSGTATVTSLDNAYWTPLRRAG